MTDVGEVATNSVALPVDVDAAVVVHPLLLYRVAVTVNGYEPSATDPAVETVAVKGPAVLPEPLSCKHWLSEKLAPVGRLLAVSFT